MSLYVCPALVLLLFSFCILCRSSCDWSFAGSREAGAKLRVKLTPSAHTFRDLLDREKQLMEIKQKAAEMRNRKKSAQDAMLEVAAPGKSEKAGGHGALEKKGTGLQQQT